jgi:hypothetical protein
MATIVGQQFHRRPPTMTAIVLPDIDKATLEDLKKRIPDLSEFELPDLPSMKKVSKTADQTIDRLLGRSRAPVWPWIVAGLGLVALIGVVAAWFAWFRRPSWQEQPEPWSEGAVDAGAVDAGAVDAGAVDAASEMSSMSKAPAFSADTDDSTLQPVMDDQATPVKSGSRSSRSGTGLSAAERSLGSTPYPIEEA